MNPTLCIECSHRSRCESFGLSSQLAARLMIGKMVTDKSTPFPFSVYLPEMEKEGVSEATALAFMEALKHDCLYLQ